MDDTPIPYTANPLTLLVKDVALFFHLTLDLRNLSLLSIVWPICPSRSPSDELAFTRDNTIALTLHGILIVYQLFVLLFVIFGPFFVGPTIAYLAVITIAIWLNRWFCLHTLNAHGQGLFYGGGDYAKDAQKASEQLVPKEVGQEGERWVFINGVAAGSQWTQSNVNRLAKMFRRPILGIHNPTYGIIFDVLECIIQRTFSYPTRDIRHAYEQLSGLIENEHVSKVVLIAHSQGSIEAGMVLDWLYATSSADDVSKIEVYTFGNATNHWNCPRRPGPGGGPVIRHIEHYANTKDWVSRFGVLFVRGIGPTGRRQHRPAKSSGSFSGKLFLRKASGHQFNQHYLNNMFTMDPAEQNVLGGNDFMGTVVDGDNFEQGIVDAHVIEEDSGAVVAANGAIQPAQQIKDRSRLWMYRNGGSPGP